MLLIPIASRYDFCAPATVTTGNFTVNENTKKITIPDGISFGANQQAIVKFTLKDDPNLVFNATQLTVSVGTSTYTVTPASATSEFFVALPGFSNQMVTLTATDGTNNVKYVKDGVSFANGQYYEIGVQMTYLISTLDQWNGFAAKVNDGHAAIRAKQTDNISGVATVVGNSESNPFRGSYNGQGYTISNVNISGTTNVGLFGYVSNASSVIENVVVASGTVSGSDVNVGAVVGQLSGGTVRYCANYAEVKSTSTPTNGRARVGGIVGMQSSGGGDNNLVSYCINYGCVHGKGYVGGIVGSFGAGFITYCQNYGLIEATGAHGAGGVAGWQSLKAFRITKSHNGGNVMVSNGSCSYPSRSHYLIGSNHLLNPTTGTGHLDYPTNTYLYTLTVTVAGTTYTEGDLTQFETGATYVTSNPAGITICGTTYTAPQN